MIKVYTPREAGTSHILKSRETSCQTLYDREKPSTYDLRARKKVSLYPKETGKSFKKAELNNTITQTQRWRL